MNGREKKVKPIREKKGGKNDKDDEQKGARYVLLNENLERTKEIYSGSTPLQAAKKAYRVHKGLQLVVLVKEDDTENEERFVFQEDEVKASAQKAGSGKGGTRVLRYE